MAILVYSHVDFDATPGASVLYICAQQTADGTTTPFPATLRV